MDITVEVTGVEKRNIGAGYTVKLQSVSHDSVILWIDTDNPQSFPIGSSFDLTLNIREDQ